jgi:hypothetical protein
MKSYLLVKFAYPVYFLLILAVHFLGEGLDYLFHSAGLENGRRELVRKSSPEMEAPYQRECMLPTSRPAERSRQQLRIKP